MRRSGRIAAHSAQNDADTTVKTESTDNPSANVKPKLKGEANAGRKSKDKKAVQRSSDEKRAEKKWQSWEAHSTESPFPDFPHPSATECQEAFNVLEPMHRAAVEEEFKDPNTPETIPHVLDAMVVAILSSATGWSNAKRAMNSMKATYGSVFAYDEIMQGGRQKLEDTIRCGGMHVRKSGILFNIFETVQERYGKWDLDHLFEETDEQAMKELLSYKGMGPKCGFVVLSWCLKRTPFTVDTHIYRIAGLWGWIPAKATREQAQAHLDAMVPKKLKFDLHFLLIAHGRTCSRCRGGSKEKGLCEARKQIMSRLQALDGKEQDA